MIIKLKNWIKDFKYSNILIIIFTVIIFSFLFSNHWQYVLTDKGREFLVVQEILNGKVPYKDITLIYFPLAYYINALIFKIFGSSLNTLINAHTLVCMVAMTGYYYLAKEFLKEKFALILTVLVVSSCIFAPVDLFNYIVPYSCGRVYGVLAFWGCTYFLIKFIKTSNVKFAYIAALFTGFTICCKLEFLPALLLFIIGLCLSKKLTIQTYLKILLVLSIFPATIFSILFLQGVSVKNLTDSLIFSFNFARTPVMTEFLSNAGVYPFDFQNKLFDIFMGFGKIAKLLILSYIGLLVLNKYRFGSIILIILISFLCLEHDWRLLQESWVGFPMLIAIIFLFSCKKLFSNDKPALLFLLATFFLCQREFFHMSLAAYSSYSLPFVLLSIILLINKFLPEYIFNIKVEKLLYMAVFILIILYTNNLFYNRIEKRFPIYTEKGTIYTSSEMSDLVTQTIRFINDNVDKDATILVLPEGNFINFVTGRKVDMRCFLMDRLYHDAYGEEKSRDIIADTQSDYIILVKGLDIYLFNRPDLYNKLSTSSSKYIYNNYDEIEEFSGEKGSTIKILKKH